MGDKFLDSLMKSLSCSSVSIKCVSLVLLLLSGGYIRLVHCHHNPLTF